MLFNRAIETSKSLLLFHCFLDRFDFRSTDDLIFDFLDFFSADESPVPSRPRFILYCREQSSGTSSVHTVLESETVTVACVLT